jgi:hypothetical protein
VAPHAAISPANHPIDIDSFSFKARFGLNLILDWRRNDWFADDEIARTAFIVGNLDVRERLVSMPLSCSPRQRYELVLRG